MNKNIKIIIGILIIVLIIVIGIVVVYKLIENSVTNREDFKFNAENISSTAVDTINNEQNKDKSEEISNNGVDEDIEKLIVVNVKEKTLQTIDFENTLYIVSVKNEDMSKFKQGQEIKVYFDGIIETSYPGIIRADKIKISKEKTNKEIPTEVLRYYSYSQNNISVQIKELSNKNIVFEIIDSNEIPLEYGNDYEYTIFKKNIENEEYNDNLEIDYNAITPAITTDSYSTTSSYSPDPNRFKKVWEEVEIIGDEDNKNCEWKNNLEDNMILEGRSDWTNVYGELNEGEYEFRMLRKPSEKDSFFREILINFIIDEKGNLTYHEPEFRW